MTTITVSQLNRYIKAVLDEDKKLSGLFIKGEIFNFVQHRQSGHCYFSLRDANSSIRAVLFKSHADALRFEPENGMAVLVQANVSVYERDGAYQLYVTDMQPDGAGALAVAFEQRKKKLAEQGFFDNEHKKRIPAYPTVIGIVTSESGAALQDILHVVSRRYPQCTLRISPAIVQGEAAAPSLIRALEHLDTNGDCDVIIIGRGGGSAEDLWCFNDEKLAHAIFQAQTPIISAVGHETDYTICDFVADLRAPTPSAAAELATPSMVELLSRLQDKQARLVAGMRSQIEHSSKRIQAISSRNVWKTPMHYVYSRQQRLDFLSQSLYNKKHISLQPFEHKLAAVSSLLDSLSPLRILQRGYCMAMHGEQVLSSVSHLVQDQEIDLRLQDGTASAVIRKIVCQSTENKKERDVAKHGQNSDL